MNPDHLHLIQKLNYIPVGLGEAHFGDEWMQDKKGNNIANKNKNYGEYTFHYWLWKNYLDEIDSDWVGFCQYRKFFVKEKMDEKNISFDQLKSIAIHDIESENNDYDCILGSQFSVKNFKLIKIIKRHFYKFLSKPSALFSEKNRTIKFHFDLFHGSGNLNSAIDLLDDTNKEDFRNFVTSRTSFNPHNMFICRTKFLKKYYETIFPWLKRCEKVFGHKNLEGYGMQRIYGFLAERYLSYWFQKHTNVIEYPIVFKDLSDYKNF